MSEVYDHIKGLIADNVRGIMRQGKEVGHPLWPLVACKTLTMHAIECNNNIV